MLRPAHLPTISVRPGQDRRVKRGHPWVFAGELAIGEAERGLDPGCLVRLADAKGAALGTATFNARSVIAARVLERDPDIAIDRAWIAARIGRALALRVRTVGGQFCRLIHTEADGLPGLIVDRYGDVLVAQPNTAGMDRLWPEIEAALDEAVAPKTIVVAGDAAARALEGLEGGTTVVRGALDGPVRVEENGILYLADLVKGQKTGWFYDQRDTRAFVAGLSDGADVLDMYSYTGGFALACARGGARAVTAVDGSKAALDLAAAAAELNGVAARCTFRAAEAFGELTRLAEAGARFDVVVTDPPAFAKSKADVAPALKGYRKLARLAARVTAPGGILCAASCSHHVAMAAFQDEVARGLWTAGRGARIVRAAGAAPDHPVHPMLPQSAYLKALVLALD